MMVCAQDDKTDARKKKLLAFFCEECIPRKDTCCECYLAH